MKAILVIDVPEDVTEVICAYDDREGFTHQRFLKVRPLPEKENPDRLEKGTYFKAYDTGWNDCLEEITGETE